MRVVWYITIGIVAIAGGVFLLRVLNDKRTRNEPTDSIHLMLRLLEEDPQVRDERTKTVVEQVAALAERGRVNTAEAFFALGLRHYGQGHYAAAESAYRESIARKPEWSRPYNTLAMTLHRLGRMEDAEAAVREAIRLDPEWVRARNSLIILLRLFGRLDEAEAEAEAALALSPNDHATHNNYGNLLFMEKRYEEAQWEYRRAVDINPTHPTPYYNLACLYSIQGRKAAALDYLAQAIARDTAFREEAKTDPDFDPIRADPAFQQLVQETD